MAKFMLSETAVNGSDEAKTVRLGAGSGTANNMTSVEVGKAVKLTAESRYDLCAAGDPIEGFIAAVESATQDAFTIGSIVCEGYKNVTFDGLEATAGTGVIALGDYVLAGTAVAKGTALTVDQKVVKATQQPGSVPADLTAAGKQARNAIYAWRVVSLGTAGTGAVGTAGLVERVNC